MYCMWSTDEPSDIIKGTAQINDIEESFGIAIDDDVALELYDLDLDEAVIRILAMLRLQDGGGDAAEIGHA